MEDHASGVVVPNRSMRETLGDCLANYRPREGALEATPLWAAECHSRLLEGILKAAVLGREGEDAIRGGGADLPGKLEYTTQEGADARQVTEAMWGPGGRVAEVRDKCSLCEPGHYERL